MSVLNKYKRWKTQLLMLLDHYWDFVLSLDGAKSIDVDGSLTTDCLISYIDTNRQECHKDMGLCSLSEYAWPLAMCKHLKLDNIGFTGIDNGLISFVKGDVSNEEFLKILTDTHLESDEDSRLHLQFVTGNTGQFTYDYEISEDSNDKFVTLKGGFLQGFYKALDKEYQVLPQYIEDEWDMEFVIRPKDYECKDTILNALYPDNKGIFFYMGTRAENKFKQLYGCDFRNYPVRNNEISRTCALFYETNYIGQNNPLAEDKEMAKYAFLTPQFLDEYGFDDTNHCAVPTNKPIEDEEEQECDSANDEYMGFDISINDNSVVNDSEGNPLSDNNHNSFTIVTDNKFLTYDRTKDGIKVKDGLGDAQVVFHGRKIPRDTNLYLLMNRTKTGITVNTIDKYITNHSSEIECDINRDIKDNAFALKLNDDGSISYKYAMTDCENENHWSIQEERTFPSLIKNDEWNVVHVKFKILRGDTDKCGAPLGKRKMKIYIYVNGYLKLVSKELYEFNFRGLDETANKQEGVPFNISLGGGTQGLAEMMWLKYCDVFDRVLPLESNFAGTFIGDIRSFKFYNCPLQYNQIKNNFIYEYNSDSKFDKQ